MHCSSNWHQRSLKSPHSHRHSRLKSRHAQRNSLFRLLLQYIYIQQFVSTIVFNLTRLVQLHSDLSTTLQHELRHQQQQQQELLRSRSERDAAREEAAAAAKDVISLRALLQVSQLRQTERENASKELLADSFEAERGRLTASLADKVS
jgi:hypothetical protein